MNSTIKSVLFNPHLSSPAGTHSTRAFVRKNFDTHTHTLERLARAQYEAEQQMEPTDPDVKPESWIPGVWLERGRGSHSIRKSLRLLAQDITVYRQRQHV